eukprot:364654-Prymnesium_polylepis.1
MAELTVSAALLLRKKAGLGLGDDMALSAHNSVAYVAVSLGAMSIGAVCVHLNWRLPDEVNAGLVKDLGCKALLHSRAFKKVATSTRRLAPTLAVLKLEA